MWEFEDESVTHPSTPTASFRPWFHASSHNTPKYFNRDAYSDGNARRLEGTKGSTWSEIPDARQSFAGEPTLPIGKPFIRITYQTTDEDGHLYDHAVSLGSKHLPSLQISYQHKEGDPDRDEFFEPTQEQIKEWTEKYTEEVENEAGRRRFKKFGRPKFQPYQHHPTLSKSGQDGEVPIPSRIETENFEDHERRIAEEFEGIDSEIYEGVYTGSDPIEDFQDAITEWEDEAEIFQTNTKVYNYFKHLSDNDLVSLLKPLPPPKQLRQPKWSNSAKAATGWLPNKTQKDECERILKGAMGEDFYPPEIARSRVINTNKETTTKTYKPKSYVVNISMHPSSNETALWERGIRASWNADDSSETYDDGVYMLVERRNQPPRVYFITYGSDPITYGDQSCCPLDTDTYRAARRYLYDDKDIHPLAKGYIRHLCFIRTGGLISELVVTLSQVYVTDLMSKKS